MKLLAWLLLALSAAETARSKAHHQTLSSWGQHSFALANATSQSRARNATHSKAHVGLRKTGTSLLAAGESLHNLRVCNAFPYTTAIDVFRGEPPGEVHKLTTRTGPLPYRRCFDMKSVQLQSGDRLHFQIGDVHLGTFALTDVPAASSAMTLLLVFYRNDRMSTSMRFASHAFEDKYQPQIAVIDTYHGPTKSWIELSDSVHAEEIAYNTVITVETGTFEVKLKSRDQEEKPPLMLDARSHETYVVMRTGVKAYDGPSYPEQLVTFPGGWNSQASVKRLSVMVLVSLVMSLWA